MKQKSIYSCQQCGYQSPKWLGKCPDCNQWDTLVEEQVVINKRSSRALPPPAVVQSISAVSVSDDDRVSCGIAELDRVLGGGLSLAHSV